MPIFVPSLRRANPARITELLDLCTRAIRASCEGKEEHGTVSGVFDNYEQMPAIRELSYIFSAKEEEKMYRENLRSRPYKATKRPIFQEISGKCFYCPDPITVRHGEIKAFLSKLEPLIREMGFTRCLLTPVAIQRAQRTVLPSNRLSPIRVSDVVLGEMVYMVKVELAWDTLPTFPEAPEPAAEEENTKTE